MNDLNRLLDDAVPEPRRALAADDLVRRARRRRMARTAALASVTAVAVLAGVAVAGGGSGPARIVATPTSTPAPEPTGKPTATVTVGTTEVRWPEDHRAKVRCVSKHPVGLADLRVAFAGTVTDVRYGPIPKEGPTPVEIDFAVERVYRGALGATVTLRTTDAFLPARTYGINGTRVLAATDGSPTMRFCGYTRTYKPEDAALWEGVFRPGLDVCEIATEGQPAERDARDYVGMTYADAAARAESESLTVRRYVSGERWYGTKDLRPDRLNLCDRDGVVVAAARF